MHTTSLYPSSKLLTFTVAATPSFNIRPLFSSLELSRDLSNLRKDPGITDFKKSVTINSLGILGVKAHGRDTTEPSVRALTCAQNT